MGGLLGGPKGMLAPPSQIIGGAWSPLPPPPLPTLMPSRSDHDEYVHCQPFQLLPLPYHTSINKSPLKSLKETIDKLAYPGVSAPYSFSFDKKSRNTRNNVSLTVQSCRIVLRRFLKISAIELVGTWRTILYCPDKQVDMSVFKRLRFPIAY